MHGSIIFNALELALSIGKGAKEPFPDYGINAKIKSRDLSPLRAGGGKTSQFVCGYMSCDPYLSRPILGGLPSVFKVNIRTDRCGQWLESSILHLVEEAASGRVGSEAMLAKLSEALFVDTMRRYVDGLPEQQIGGSRERVIPSSGKASDCYMPALRIRGRLRLLRMR